MFITPSAWRGKRKKIEKVLEGFLFPAGHKKHYKTQKIKQQMPI